MKITFELDASLQTISRTDGAEPVSDSVQFLEAELIVSNASGKACTPLFTKNGEAYTPEFTQTVVDDKQKVVCFVPATVLAFDEDRLTVTEFGVSLFTSATETEERITFPPVMIPVVRSGFAEGSVVPAPTSQAYEQLLKLLEAIKGGDAGKMLSKETDADYAFKWVDPQEHAVMWGHIEGEIQNQTDLAMVLASYADEIDKKVNNDGSGVSSALYQLDFNSNPITEDTQIIVQDSDTKWVRRKADMIWQ